MLLPKARRDKCVMCAGLQEIETGCPELRIINFNGCMTLFRLALGQQPQLDRVEASGCKALRNVISNSSVLSSCYLQACPRLTVSRHIFVSPYFMTDGRWQASAAWSID